MSASLRPAFIGGAMLVLLGVLLLLNQLGVLPDGVPIGSVLVIGLGALLIMGGTRAAADAPVVADVPTAVDLDGASAARLVLNHGAGVLTVSGGAGAGRLVEGFVTGGVQQRVTRAGERVDVELRPSPEWQRWPLGAGKLSWNLAVSAVPALELEVNTGASQVRLDLSGLSVSRIKVQTGASDVELRVPAHGQCHVFVVAGAANVRIDVPEGVAAAVRNRTALAGFTVDESRFTNINGTFMTADYDTATDRAEIEVEGGVASFAVR